MIDDVQKANVVPIGTTQSKSSLAQQASDARAQLARLPAPVHRLREKSVALLQQTLKTLFDGADDALFDLADRANNNQDQNTYFEAMREVRLKRRDTETAFFTALDQGFAKLLKSVPDQDDVYVADISLDELSLVDNDQLEFQVAVESMVAKVFERCAEPAQHIALRLDSLLPAKVYQQNNPVGPDRLCNNFWKVIEPLDVDIKAKLVLLKLFDKAVMAQLHKVYSVLNNLLIQQNVLPSLSTKAQRRQGARPSASTVRSSADQSSGALDVASEQGQVLQQLRELMSSGSAGGVETASTTGGSTASVLTARAQSSNAIMGVDELTQVLSQLQQHLPATPDTQAGLLDNQQLLSMITPAARGNAAMSSVDQDVMNLINMLFQFILDDRNLAPAMQSVLARLQIPLLKVAVVDKSFFNKAGHPARRLLNELATAALGWQEPEKGAQRDPLFRKVSSVVETVIGEFESDVHIFETLLTDFIAFTEKEQRRATVLEKRTLDAEDGKAKSEQARAQVSRALDSVVQGRKLPTCVEQMIEGPWHNVLFLNLLKHGEDSDEWRDACFVVEQLVWSVTESLDSDGRSKLMSLLPTLLPRLREGFETISYNPFEMNSLLNQLEKEHLRQLRSVSQPAESQSKGAPNEGASKAGNDNIDSSQKSDAETRKAKTASNLEAGATEKPAMTTGPSDSDESSIETQTPSEQEVSPCKADHAEQALVGERCDVVDTADTCDVEAKVSPSPERASTPTPIDESASAEPTALNSVSASWLEQVDRFAQGSWFEVSEANKPAYRCRLAAVIKAVDKYIFVNRNGMKVAEKTREELAVALQQGQFSMLDDGMLFDRALESVIGNLRESRGSVS